MSKHDLHPDPADDVTGNGLESHYDLARQLEMRGYTVDADSEDNEHSYVRFGDEHVGDIRGDAVATVTTCPNDDGAGHAARHEDWQEHAAENAHLAARHWDRD